MDMNADDVVCPYFSFLFIKFLGPVRPVIRALAIAQQLEILEVRRGSSPICKRFFRAVNRLLRVYPRHSDFANNASNSDVSTLPTIINTVRMK